MGLRRKSRELALKVLYSLEYSETDELLGTIKWLELYPEKIQEVVEEFEAKQDNRIIEFADFLIKNTIMNCEEIDREIEKNSSNWTIDRIALMDKSLLRISVMELLKTETPPAIIMDEAIEIAKKYCSESTRKFINGVLNSIAKNKE